MNKKSILLLIIIIVFAWVLVNLNTTNDNYSKRVKVSLRNVGNQLLIADKDSTSLVLPIITTKSNTFKLSFQNQLSIEPRNLVGIIENNFKKSNFPDNYIIEVKNCSNQEVVYSSEITDQKENNIIPCFGRVLPKSCYIIELNLINKKPLLGKSSIVFALLLGVLPIILIKKKKKIIIKTEENTDFISIGIFKFYQEQNKLVSNDLDIKLSNKECEILSIFIAKPNQIIKREELTKKVWEDKGVIVGRSLDTYISKLRKKLQADDTIKLLNVHGIGYKLEITPQTNH